MNRLTANWAGGDSNDTPALTHETVPLMVMNGLTTMAKKHTALRYCALQTHSVQESAVTVANEEI